MHIKRINTIFVYGNIFKIKYILHLMLYFKQKQLRSILKNNNNVITTDLLT